MQLLVWSLVFFFFVKQKTAYEMRISDWSSDVCSSDLLQPAPHALHVRPVFVAALGGEVAFLAGDHGDVHDHQGRHQQPEHPAAVDPFRQDRKRVVRGKRVSGRVELRGGRIYKKNNQIKHHLYTTRYKI